MTEDKSDPAELQAQVADLEADARVDAELIAMLQGEHAADSDTIANLREALTTCRRIGGAIGILMATRKITEDQAFDVLKATSQNINQKLRAVADTVVLTGALPA